MSPLTEVSPTNSFRLTAYSTLGNASLELFSGRFHAFHTTIKASNEFLVESVVHIHILAYEKPLCHPLK